jgi:hypothetical protein
MTEIILNELAKKLFATTQKSRDDRIDLNKICSKSIKVSHKGISILELSEKTPVLVEKVKALVAKHNDDLIGKGVKPIYELSELILKLMTNSRNIVISKVWFCQKGLKGLWKKN